MKITDYLNNRYKYYSEFMFGKNCLNFNRDLILDKWRDNLKFIRKIGLYIHIPYCKNICYFCDCFSKLGKQTEIENYTNLLISEIKKFAPVFREIKFDTLYFGGGTPSMLSEECLTKLLEAIYTYFDFKKDAHSSFEGSPQTLSDNKLNILKKFNFKRLTIGVQSFDGEVLKRNNRPIASENLVKCLVEKCKKLDILINLELICGLNGQSLKSFLVDVKKIVEIRPNQIHLYYFECNPATLIWHKNGGRFIKKMISWRNKGLKMAGKDYKFFPFSGPADQFNAINVQIYNNRIYNSSLLGLGDSAISNINNGFRYGSILQNNVFVYKKVLKRFIKYAEVFNL